MWLGAAKLWRGVCFVATFGMLLGIVSCAQVSEEEKATEAYSDLISVEGFRESGRESRAGDIILTFVGPASVDLRQAIKAPNFILPDGPPGGGAGGRVFEYLAEVNGISFDGFLCRLSVERLKVGPEIDDLLDSLGMEAGEVEDVRGGASLVLQMVTRCRENRGQ